MYLGRNGAGKTTCLKMISGLSTPSYCEIEMFGYKGKDLQQARFWFQKAIDNGHEKAKEALTKIKSDLSKEDTEDPLLFT